MFALPNPPVLISPMILTVTIGLIIAIAFLLLRVAVVSRRAGSAPPDGHASDDARKCQYCRRGEATLREETVRLDGDDLVDVRCYVCSSCGLPQWWIQRRGISPHVH
jgi:hypothetical protein